MNEEFDRYERVTTADVHREAQIIFSEKNSNTIHYYAGNQA